jgi:hypothetical protein
MPLLLRRHRAGGVVVPDVRHGQLKRRLPRQRMLLKKVL